MVVFILSTIYLPYRIFKSKSRIFLYILPIVALMESIGRLIRYICVEDTTLSNYILMALFLLLPPNALALVYYKAVGEIIRLSNIPVTRFYLKHKFVTWSFISSDVFFFFYKVWVVEFNLQQQPKVLVDISQPLV
jgi:hypothetical protein